MSFSLAVSSFGCREWLHDNNIDDDNQDECDFVPLNKKINDDDDKHKKINSNWITVTSSEELV